MVGAPAIYLEPHSHLSSDVLFSPSPLTSSDSFCDSIPFPVIPESTETPIISCAPTNNDSPVADLADMTDSELEKMLSPFSSGSDSSFDPDHFDLESFMSA